MSAEDRYDPALRAQDQDPDVPQDIPEPVDIRAGAKTDKAKKAVEEYLKSPDAKHLHTGERYPGNLDLPAKTPEEIRQEMDRFTGPKTQHHRKHKKSAEEELKEGERAPSPFRDQDQDPDAPQDIPEPRFDLLHGARTEKAKQAVQEYLKSPDAKNLHGGEELPGNLDLPAKTPEEIRKEMDQLAQRVD